MAYTTIDNPELFFQTKLYTGNGGTLAVTLDGDENMQPDFVWLKDRSAANGHFLYDSVRGVTKELNAQTTQTEQTKSGGLTAFGSDGFTIGDYTGHNDNSTNYVSWNWKAGTSFSNDASATGVGTIDSTGSVSTDVGISIMSYTGNGSNSASFAHGLGVKPQIVLIKNRSTGKNWIYWQDTTGNGTSDIRLVLNLTNGNYNNYHVTFGTSTITLGDTDDAWNKSGDNLIAYCFAEKKGYSKFSGSYTGNGNADGTFVYTGFKPAFVMTKKTSSSTARNWCILDNKRSSSGANVVDDRLFPNLADAEDSSTSADFLSNGFKLRDNAGEFNQAVSYIYMAFAESPFVNSKGVPTNAR
jgi:hypothetical protein